MVRHTKGIITNKPIVLNRLNTITYRINKTETIELFEGGSLDIVIHAQKTYPATKDSFKYTRSVEFIIDEAGNKGDIYISEDGSLDSTEVSKDFIRVLMILHNEKFNYRTINLFTVLYQKHLKGGIIINCRDI